MRRVLRMVSAPILSRRQRAFPLPALQSVCPYIPNIRGSHSEIAGT
jgi:hypothetical protein